MLPWHDGESFALEVRTENGRPMKEQLDTSAAMEAAGAYCCIAYGIERWLQVLEGWGIAERAWRSDRTRHLLPCYAPRGQRDGPRKLCPELGVAAGG